MKRFHFYLGWAALGVALAGCSRELAGDFQGYVEGEFVHVATSGAGRLERLPVARGDRVAAGAPLFSLEAESEQAAPGRLATGRSAPHFFVKMRSKAPPSLKWVACALSQARWASSKTMTRASGA